ncbi:MAG: phosphatidylglycerol lysyltransferase domain-containing protein, partial [Peptococcia bacterium]
QFFPGKFSYQDDREGYDYIYTLEKLVSLSGKKLQSKRNHINRFIANNADWSFEEISQDNLSECWEMNQEWCRQNGCKDDELLNEEYCAVRRCFNNYEALELEGGLLRLAGKVIAFTMGERLNSDTYVVHIEKAFGEIQGAYQLINREFAKLIQERHPDIVYVNREEDMGYEGLRRAKMSYRPVRMEEKYVADATSILL